MRRVIQYTLTFAVFLSFACTTGTAPDGQTVAAMTVHEQHSPVEGVIGTTPVILGGNPLYLPTDRPIKTARTGDVAAAATGSQCTSNTCQPGGCELRDPSCFSTTRGSSRSHSLLSHGTIHA